LNRFLKKKSFTSSEDSNGKELISRTEAFNLSIIQLISSFTQEDTFKLLPNIWYNISINIAIVAITPEDLERVATISKVNTILLVIGADNLRNPSRNTSVLNVLIILMRAKIIDSSFVIVSSVEYILRRDKIPKQLSLSMMITKTKRIVTLMSIFNSPQM
jgi:hypothetical protein